MTVSTRCLHLTAGINNPAVTDSGIYACVYRVPTPPGKSWKVLDICLENSRTWKVTLVLESPGN